MSQTIAGTFRGQLLAARPSKNRDGIESTSFADVKILQGEDVYRGWAFLDDVVDANGEFPALNGEVECDFYAKVKVPDNGRPYLTVQMRKLRHLGTADEVKNKRATRAA